MLCILSFIVSYLVISSNAFRCDNKPSKRAENNAILIWPDGIVPYEIEDVYLPEEKQIIRDTLKNMSDSTDNCVNFIERTDTHRNWIHVVSKDGCYSSVGRRSSPGVQELSLDRSGCFGGGTVLHEFMHALGFHHEQTRPDRDQYIEILYDNMNPNKTYNYDINPSAKHQTITPYDFESIMHYSYLAATINGLPTMTPISNDARHFRYFMGPGGALTKHDIYKIKNFYGCI
ncbi:hypothetical protein I4U23_012093 [Adineta vaga]|nr:hypothetical protein I4U23_012093 [Adineta vaga]